jgi:hypothetical protein
VTARDELRAEIDPEAILPGRALGPATGASTGFEYPHSGASGTESSRDGETCQAGTDDHDVAVLGKGVGGVGRGVHGYMVT